VNAALEDLKARYPALAPHLFSGEGSLRPFVNLFLDEENVQDLQGSATPLEEGDRLLIIPSIAGGK
jgi:adenylyltransferase/sulfurtransferase